MFSWISSDNYLLLCYHHLKQIVEYYHHPRQCWPSPINHPSQIQRQPIPGSNHHSYLFIYCLPASYKWNQQCAFFCTEIILFNIIFLRFTHVSMSIIHYFFLLSIHCIGHLCGSVAKNLLAKQETQVWSLAWEDSLKKEMATHSSILAWEIPWTEAPSGL